MIPKICANCESLTWDDDTGIYYCYVIKKAINCIGKSQCNEERFKMQTKSRIPGSGDELKRSPWGGMQ